MLLQKIKLLLIACALLIIPKAYAGNNDSSAVKFSGYIDAYYAAYTDSLGVGSYQKYATISPRSKQFGLNIAMLTARYDTKNVRGVFTLHYGDIPRSSWSANYNFIQEANAGIRLSKNLWLDAGFFHTHIGTEACLPKDNYTSSVALLTFSEPYYEAGARLNYNPTEKFSIYLYGLNGYNIYEDNNQKKSVGLLATYTFGEHLNIGYSGYYGDDANEGESSHTRQFHNVFLNFKGKKLKVTAGVDFASQQRSALGHTSDGHIWGLAGGGMLIVSYQATEKFRVYGRGDYFNDRNGFLSGVFVDKTNHTTGLIATTETLGLEYKPTGNSYIRLEGRNISADKNQEIFYPFCARRMNCAASKASVRSQMSMR